MDLWKGPGEVVLAIIIQCGLKTTFLKEVILGFFGANDVYCGIVKEFLLSPLLHTMADLDLIYVG